MLWRPGCLWKKIKSLIGAVIPFNNWRQWNLLSGVLLVLIACAKAEKNSAIFRSKRLNVGGFPACSEYKNTVRIVNKAYPMFVQRLTTVTAPPSRRPPPHVPECLAGISFEARQKVAIEKYAYSPTFQERIFPIQEAV